MDRPAEKVALDEVDAPAKRRHLGVAEIDALDGNRGPLLHLDHQHHALGIAGHRLHPQRHRLEVAGAPQPLPRTLDAFVLGPQDLAALFDPLGAQHGADLPGRNLFAAHDVDAIDGQRARDLVALVLRVVGLGRPGLGRQRVFGHDGGRLSRNRSRAGADRKQRGAQRQRPPRSESEACRVPPAHGRQV